MENKKPKVYRKRRFLSTKNVARILSSVIAIIGTTTAVAFATATNNLVHSDVEESVVRSFTTTTTQITTVTSTVTTTTTEPVTTLTSSTTTTSTTTCCVTTTECVSVAEPAVIETEESTVPPDNVILEEEIITDVECVETYEVETSEEEAKVVETVETVVNTTGHYPVDMGIITEEERILLCNVVGNEYGADFVPTAEKAKVVAVVMNRVYSELYPNTIYEVLTQPYQFSGYYVQYSYTHKVSDDVVRAVDYYFENPGEFGNWLSFYGDGTWNHFS